MTASDPRTHSRRGKRRSRAPIRSPYRQPTWLIVGVVIIALGTAVLAAAALMTFGG